MPNLLESTFTTHCPLDLHVLTHWWYYNDGSYGDGSYRNAGNCGDFISYNASTGVVTMNEFCVDTQNQIRMTVMFKLYMIY